MILCNHCSSACSNNIFVCFTCFFLIYFLSYRIKEITISHLHAIPRLHYFFILSFHKIGWLPNKRRAEAVTVAMWQWLCGSGCVAVALAMWQWHWLCGSGYVAVAVWRWLCGGGCVAVAVSQWLCGSGCVAEAICHSGYAMLQWLCHRGYVTVAMSQRQCGNGYVAVAM